MVIYNILAQFLIAQLRILLMGHENRDIYHLALSSGTFPMTGAFIQLKPRHTYQTRY